MDGTILQQGIFTSTGNPQTIILRSDLDCMWVYNLTQAGITNTPGRGVQFYWQRGMSVNDGLIYQKGNGSDAIGMTTAAVLGVNGFTLVDSTIPSIGAPVTISNIAGAGGTGSTPRVTGTSNPALQTGMTVRMFSVVGANQLNGVDFTVARNNDTTFDLAYMPSIALNGATTGSYRVIPYGPLYYPSTRTISAVTKGTTTIVKMTVTHNLTVGQVVRFIVPNKQVSGVYIFGMQQLNGLKGTIIAINTTTNTITVDIDSSGFDAFTFPTTAQAAGAITYAQVVPVGETDQTQSGSTILNPNLLDDATYNTGYLGILLGAGINSPAGSASDQIAWVAGKSWNVSN